MSSFEPYQDENDDQPLMVPLINENKYWLTKNTSSSGNYWLSPSTTNPNI